MKIWLKESTQETRLHIASTVFKEIVFETDFCITRYVGQYQKAYLFLVKTSDAGSQYRCGRVGRGIQPHPHPNPPPTLKHTLKVSKTLVFPLFNSMTTDRRTDRRTDGRTDKASYRVACPQLKRRNLKGPSSGCA